MGMAASQARYLALVARKSNCEYEGQQINQARTILSNQSANLFNQMLGLNVPTPPSTQDYSKIQYSYKDGINDCIIESWQQLSAPEEEYNYIVTHHYYVDEYTGAQKMLADPQVQFDSGDAVDIEALNAAILALNEAQTAYDTAMANTDTKYAEISNLATYADNTTYSAISGSSYDTTNDIYTFQDATSATDIQYVSFDSITDADTIALIESSIGELVDVGALDKDLENLDLSDVYYNESNGTIAFKVDLANLYGGSGVGQNTSCPIYHLSGEGSIDSKYQNFSVEFNDLQQIEASALSDLQAAQSDYESLSKPSYIGNTELTLLSSLDESQETELSQIIKDMQEENIENNIASCFDANGNYLGGIYQFKLHGTTYYTTYTDLLNSYSSGTGNNKIDGQTKLPYYHATYSSEKVESTEKALLETDETGRFVSVRFEGDTVTYTLNAETVTDELAYQDAMNKYTYESALYDKTVQDINAKTSLIQQEDQQLELRLKQLDTEQSALSTEIDAVSKVVKDNIEKSFKTFGG